MVRPGYFALLLLFACTPLAGSELIKEVCLERGGRSQTCFEMYSATLNQSQAVNFCARSNGRLVSQLDGNTNEALRGLINSQLAAQVWLGATEQDSDWSGIFGPGKYTKWGRGSPDDQSGYDGCVVLDAKYGLDWMPGACNEKRAYLCSFDRACDTSDQIQTQEDGCIARFSEQVTWFQARTECQRWGGDLAAVTSEEVMSTIKFRLEGFGTSYWTRFNDKKWILTSGEELRYFNWKGGFPKQPGASCVVILQDGYWLDEDCALELPFICEKTYDLSNGNPKIEPPTNTEPPIQTPEENDGTDGSTVGETGAVTAESSYPTRLTIGFAVGGVALVILIAVIALVGFRVRNNRRAIVKRAPSQTSIDDSHFGSITSRASGSPPNMAGARRFYSNIEAPRWQGPENPEAKWEWKENQES